MIQRLYLRVFDGVSRRPAAPVTILAAAVLASLAALPSIRIDMSFRPLFADAVAESQATEEFEAIFGQASGAYVGVIVERADVLSPRSVRDLARLSAAVDSIPGVTEVLSLPRLALPVWSADVARGVPAIPPEMLERGDPAAVGAVIAEVAAADAARGVLVSEDGRKTILLARLAPPLQDLSGRTRIIREIRSLVESRVGDSSRLRFVGVSVVEAAYARIVLESLARSFALTTLALLLVLWLVFRRAAAVVAVISGSAVAIPVSMGLLAALGQELTMINSMVPVMILVIGVADAIHMMQAFAGRVRRGEPQPLAVRGMLGEVALPCLITTATTALGFLALRMAEITAIRDFGLNVAIGVCIAHVLNMAVIPTILARVAADRTVSTGHVVAGTGRVTWMARAIDLVVARPRWIAAAGMALVVACAAAVPDLRIDQRFNEEVDPTHPVRADQAVLERELGGLLGPDVEIRREDGGVLLDAGSIARLRLYVAGVRAIPGVLRVESVLDLLPPRSAGLDVTAGVERLRADSLLGGRVAELVGHAGTRTVVTVRTLDLGTARAHELAARMRLLARQHLGDGYRAELVGQWWLAQRGMKHITRDMLASFVTSCVLILPLLALALRSARLVAVAIVPNVLPVLFALAFMAWTGMSLRIGTAMILAIAVGIAVDDTVHLLVRLRTEAGGRADAGDAVRATMEGVGGALIHTTVVLVAGFLSMLSNDLIAIREMGLVAAATLTVALLADLYLAPALFLLTSRRAAATRPLHRTGAPPRSPAAAIHTPTAELES